jgi:hypothetical protein
MAGRVSQDGRYWHAEWSTMGRYIAYIPEPYEFYSAAEPECRDSLVFEKASQGG